MRTTEQIETCRNWESFKNIKEFYPFYLSQHANNLNRFIHAVGTLLTIIFFFLWNIYIKG